MGINQDFHPFPPSISEPKKHPAFLEANLFRSDVQQVIGASVTVQVGEVVGTGVGNASQRAMVKICQIFFVTKKLEIGTFWRNYSKIILFIQMQ